MPWIRSPLLHFLVLGATLFIARSWLAFDELPASESDSTITIQGEQLTELTSRFSEQMGRSPDPDELERMIGAEVDEEILYREALGRGLLERDGGVQTRLIQKMLFLDGQTTIENAPELIERAVALGLHRDDIVVRRILVQKMRLLGSALGPSEQPTSADVEARYLEQRETFREPDRRSLVHVFLSSDRRPDRSEADARALRVRLEQKAVDPKAAPALADPFPLGHHFEDRSERDLARTFGVRFGPEAFALPAGRWSEPIASAYGHHLIWIEAVMPGQVPPLASVADRIRREIEQERREEKLATLLSSLRKRYEVVVLASQETG